MSSPLSSSALRPTTFVLVPCDNNDVLSAGQRVDEMVEWRKGVRNKIEFGIREKGGGGVVSIRRTPRVVSSGPPRGGSTSLFCLNGGTQAQNHRISSIFRSAICSPFPLCFSRTCAEGLVGVACRR